MTEWISVAQVVSVLVIALAFVARRSAEASARALDQTRDAYRDTRSDVERARATEEGLIRMVEELRAEVSRLSVRLDCEQQERRRDREACEQREAELRATNETTRARLEELETIVRAGGIVP